jgi:hypothetical protein
MYSLKDVAIVTGRPGSPHPCRRRGCGLGRCGRGARHRGIEGADETYADREKIGENFLLCNIFSKSVRTLLAPDSILPFLVLVPPFV